MKTEIGLGKKLRDKVTGFTGVATVKTTFLTGNVQYNLATQVNKEGVSKDLAFDHFQLEYIGEGVDVIAAPSDTGIKLGEEVKDIITGAKGIATLESTFLNGCVYYSVSTKDAKDPKEMFVEYRRLTRVGLGVTKQIAARTEAAPEKTGGPSFKVPMRG